MAKMETHEVQVQDKALHCAGCEARVKNVLSKVPGVEQVEADHKTQRVHLSLDAERVTLEEVRDRLAGLGYRTV